MFHTRQRGLQAADGGMLTVLASDDFAASGDARGYTFLDRDSRWFPLVLSYLRGGEVCPTALALSTTRSAALTPVWPPSSSSVSAGSFTVNTVWECLPCAHVTTAWANFGL